MEDDAVDCDPAETRDWLESLEAVTRSVGTERGKYLLQQLDARAQELGIRTQQKQLAMTVDGEYQTLGANDGASEVWSVTSFSELARAAREVQRWNRLHPTVTSRTSFVADCLVGRTPVLAATDYVGAYPSMIAPFVEAPFVVLGTDGFGRSDTRASLRRFFEVDRQSIVVAALQSLVDGGQVKKDMVASAIDRYQLPTHEAPPWTR